MSEEKCNRTETLSRVDVVEFNWPLHVHKQQLGDGGEYLYTIAVWKGTTLMPLCLRQRLDSALAVLGHDLSESKPTGN